MESTIDHLEGRYGSAHNYLKTIGLSDGELGAIAVNLLQPGLELPRGGAAGGACPGVAG